MAVHLYSSPIGEIAVFSDGENITGLCFSDTLRGYHSNILTSRLPIIAQADEWLNIYFSGKQPDFTPSLKVDGTEFHRTVCGIIQSIPFSHVMTYSEIAGMIQGTSARAVGSAVAANKILLMIPCHRVTGSGGKLTGYSGGIERKRKLLTLEGADIG